MSNNYKIYKHTVPDEHQRVYIGLTSEDPKRRWSNGYGYSNNKPFFEAIQKYGWSNIEHEIIAENLSKEEAIAEERLLIISYHSEDPNYGFNNTTYCDDYKRNPRPYLFASPYVWPKKYYDGKKYYFHLGCFNGEKREIPFCVYSYAEQLPELATCIEKMMWYTKPLIHCYHNGYDFVGEVRAGIFAIDRTTDRFVKKECIKPNGEKTWALYVRTEKLIYLCDLFDSLIGLADEVGAKKAAAV